MAWQEDVRLVAGPTAFQAHQVKHGKVAALRAKSTVRIQIRVSEEKGRRAVKKHQTLNGETSMASCTSEAVLKTMGCVMKGD